MSAGATVLLFLLLLLLRLGLFYLPSGRCAASDFFSLSTGTGGGLRIGFFHFVLVAAPPFEWVGATPARTVMPSRVHQTTTPQ